MRTYELCSQVIMRYVLYMDTMMIAYVNYHWPNIRSVHIFTGRGRIAATDYVKAQGIGLGIGIRNVLNWPVPGCTANSATESTPRSHGGMHSGSHQAKIFHLSPGSFHRGANNIEITSPR